MAFGLGIQVSRPGRAGSWPQALSTRRPLTILGAVALLLRKANAQPLGTGSKLPAACCTRSAASCACSASAVAATAAFR